MLRWRSEKADDTTLEKKARTVLCNPLPASREVLKGRVMNPVNGWLVPHGTRRCAITHLRSG